MDGIRSVPPATIRTLWGRSCAVESRAATRSLCFTSMETASSIVRGRSSLNWGRLNPHLPQERVFRGAMDRADGDPVLFRDTTVIRHVREILRARLDRPLRLD